uniref:FERM domain containing 1 n=1 Tax=Neogobius melanostomus TaxID=47308 RepID=A0A8C6TSI4_9GOBI
YFPMEWKQESGKTIPKKPLPLVLCLKVQYYVENGRLLSERKARHLYYSDLRERVLRSECRQQEEVYFQLAGYALQADLGDHPPPNKDMTMHYFEPKNYFPPWIIAKRGVDYLLCHGPKVHQELWGMTSRDAILLFIRESCRLEDVPVTFYKLQKDKKAEKGTALLGLTLRGMQVYQEVNNIRQLVYDFPWSNVGRLTFLGKKFEIQPDGLPSARKLVYYTGSSFRSRHLLLHLSSSHRLYLSLQPALKHLRQLEESEEKTRYRESYISDDLDIDPPGSESSPGLSRRSTSSSGIEADTRQHSISTELPLRRKGTFRPSCVSAQQPAAAAPAPLEWRLALPKSRSQLSTDRHSQSLDDVRVLPPLTPLGTALPPDSSHSYTFGMLDASSNVKTPTEHSYYPLVQCQDKPSFYGRRSANCLSLDLLGDEQLLEFIL